MMRIRGQLAVISNSPYGVFGLCFCLLLMGTFVTNKYGGISVQRQLQINEILETKGMPKNASQSSRYAQIYNNSLLRELPGEIISKTFFVKNLQTLEPPVIGVTHGNNSLFHMIKDVTYTSLDDIYITSKKIPDIIDKYPTSISDDTIIRELIANIDSYSPSGAVEDIDNTQGEIIDDSINNDQQENISIHFRPTKANDYQRIIHENITQGKIENLEKYFTLTKGTQINKQKENINEYHPSTKSNDEQDNIINENKIHEHMENTSYCLSLTKYKDTNDEQDEIIHKRTVNKQLENSTKTKTNETDEYQEKNTISTYNKNLLDSQAHVSNENLTSIPNEDRILEYHTTSFTSQITTMMPTENIPGLINASKHVFSETTTQSTKAPTEKVEKKKYQNLMDKFSRVSRNTIHEPATAKVKHTMGQIDFDKKSTTTEITATTNYTKNSEKEHFVKPVNILENVLKGSKRRKRHTTIRISESIHTQRPLVVIDVLGKVSRDSKISESLITESTHIKTSFLMEDILEKILNYSKFFKKSTETLIPSSSTQPETETKEDRFWKVQETVPTRTTTPREQEFSVTYSTHTTYAMKKLVELKSKNGTLEPSFDGNLDVDSFYTTTEMTYHLETDAIEDEQLADLMAEEQGAFFVSTIGAFLLTGSIFGLVGIIFSEIDLLLFASGMYLTASAICFSLIFFNLGVITLHGFFGSIVNFFGYLGGAVVKIAIAVVFFFCANVVYLYYKKVKYPAVESEQS